MGKPRGIEDEIKRLRQDGLTYDQIKKELQCSKSTICYHLSKGRKGRQRLYTKENRLTATICQKLYGFQQEVNPNPKFSNLSTYLSITQKIQTFSKDIDSGDYRMNFTYQQLMEKLGDKPVCYLSGKDINIEDTASWHLDHIIPRSRGGDNSLENCGIATREANFCKNALTPEELFTMCSQILTHNGYVVEKP